MEWLLHEGYAIFCSVFHDAKMIIVANDPKRKSPNLRPLQIVSFIATAYSVVRKGQRIRPGATNSGGCPIVEAKDNTVSRTADRLGFWSAYFSAIFAIDILGYGFMSLATLFAARMFDGRGLER